MKHLVMIFILTLAACASADERELRTVSSVDVNRYIGKWYAIAALPQFFTKSCKAQIAEYEIINEQTVSVLNTCLKKKGKSTIKGQAVVTNAATNAELEVTFNNFWTRLFRVKGDYNIIKLDADYKYVTVASRDRKSLWIMAREPFMPESVYDTHIKGAKEQGFKVEKLVKSKF